MSKERTIRKELGVSVPIPGNANTIAEAVLGSILGEQVIQPSFDLGRNGNAGTRLELEATLDAEWQSAKDKAKQTQTIFAQHSLKPEEALREWDRTQESLGSEAVVERLVVSACQRPDLPIRPLAEDYWELDLRGLAKTCEPLADRLRQHSLDGQLRLGFHSPVRNGTQLVGRSHPLVVELAETSSLSGP